jgi:hypothetical protein
VLDLQTGEARQIDDQPCTAFFWTPDGHGIVIARTDIGSGIVSWELHRLADGERVHLGDMRPTRDLRFYLRFFEQFAQSHPLVDAGSQSLLVTGELERAGNAAGVWRLPLDGTKPDRVGDGLIAVWGPPSV